MGIIVYLLYQIFNQLDNRKYICIFLIFWSIMFGIDLPLFVAISRVIGLFCIRYLMVHKFQNTFSYCKSHWYIFLLPSLIILTNVFLNLKFYGSLTYNQSPEIPYIKTVVGSNTYKIWISTPLIPTLTAVLFNYQNLPTEVFSNMTTIP